MQRVQISRCQDDQSWIGDGFCKENLCVRFKCGSNLFFCCIGINKGAVNAKLFEGDGKKVEGSSVNGRSGNNVIACLADVEYCVEVGCLSGRCQDRSNTALQICDLCGNGIVGRVLETGVKYPSAFRSNNWPISSVVSYL